MSQGFTNHSKPLAGQQNLAIDGLPPDNIDATGFRATPFEPVYDLLAAVPDLAGKRAVEPCAGNGAIIRHSRRASVLLKQRPIDWQCVVEIRYERDALDTLGIPDILCPADVTMLQGLGLSPRNDIDLVLTNLPWYAETANICEAIWKLWPRARLVAMCSHFYVLDTDKDPRARWFEEHLPEYIVRIPYRIRYEGQRATYNQPIDWWSFRPGGKPGMGQFRVLPRAWANRHQGDTDGF